MLPYFGEFIGSMVMIILGGGVVAGVVLKDSKAENSGWLVISLGWGLAVTFAIYVVGNFSSAHINPAVTVSLASIGKFPLSKVPGYVAAQMLGTFAGGIVVWLHHLPHWSRTKDQAAILSVFSTSPAIRSYAANFVSELIATNILVITILFMGAGEFSKGLKPLVIGGLIMIIALGLGGTTSFAINPARDLGPRLAHFLLPIKGKGSSDWAYSWIPIAGPILGGLSGAVLYNAMIEHVLNSLFWVVMVLSIAVSVLAIVKDKKQGIAVKSKQKKLQYQGIISIRDSKIIMGETVFNGVTTTKTL